MKTNESDVTEDVFIFAMVCYYYSLFHHKAVSAQYSQVSLSGWWERRQLYKHLQRHHRNLSYWIMSWILWECCEPNICYKDAVLINVIIISLLVPSTPTDFSWPLLVVVVGSWCSWSSSCRASQQNRVHWLNSAKQKRAFSESMKKSILKGSLTQTILLH